MTYIEVNYMYDQKRPSFYVPVDSRRDNLKQKAISMGNCFTRKCSTPLNISRCNAPPLSPLKVVRLQQYETHSPLIQPLTLPLSSPYPSTPYKSLHPTPATLSHVLWHDFATDLRPYVRINHRKALHKETFERQSTIMRG